MDKRKDKSKRAKTNFPVYYQIKDPDSSIYGYTYIKNLSKDGICIRTRKDIKKGTNVFLKFMIPAIDTVIETNGKVKWSESVFDELFYAGVVFTKIQICSPSEISIEINSRKGKLETLILHFANIFQCTGVSCVLWQR